MLNRMWTCAPQEYARNAVADVHVPVSAAGTAAAPIEDHTAQRVAVRPWSTGDLAMACFALKAWRKGVSSRACGKSP